MTKLRALVKRVLNEDVYKKNAAKVRESIRQSGGFTRAVDMVEQVIATREPVFAEQEQHNSQLVVRNYELP